ncbi:hypothetical protein [Paenarthrobacter nitroguajacolicus]|nr:hypothetical protein [Paenarthrobacter nitroguajacolicus]MDR6638414.1 putative amidohydrolase YtcJ [Paenarthrobacter nitroguajacolicus]
MAAGLYADFVVPDTDVCSAGNHAALLDTKILRTVVGGRTVHQADHTSAG